MTERPVLFLPPIPSVPAALGRRFGASTARQIVYPSQACLSKVLPSIMRGCFIHLELLSHFTGFHPSRQCQDNPCPFYWLDGFCLQVPDETLNRLKTTRKG
jgi:hypothetical protein